MAAVTAILDIRTILTILNLHVDPMLPDKIQLNLTYESGDVENVKTFTADRRTENRQQATS